MYSEKSTLWTDAGADQNFQEVWESLVHMNFRTNSYGPMTPCASFSRKWDGLMVLKCAVILILKMCSVT